jgi:hypothetical protein
MKKIVQLKTEETKAIVGGVNVVVPAVATGVNSSPVAAQRR